MKYKLAERLKELRAEKGLSQVALAEAIGVDPGFIGHIETSKVFVSVDTLVLLADVFEVSTDYLLGREGFGK